MHRPIEPGLCATCLHSRMVPGRASHFRLCRLSETDRRFPRYPRLPVLTCGGYSPAPSGAGRARPA